MTKDELYDKQVRMLKAFLEKGAISKAQYATSYNNLTKKMYPERLKNDKDQ